MADPKAGKAAAMFDWSTADKYARNYVLNSLVSISEELEKEGVKIADQRAYAARAAIMLLSRAEPRG